MMPDTLPHTHACTAKQKLSGSKPSMRCGSVTPDQIGNPEPFFYIEGYAC